MTLSDYLKRHKISVSQFARRIGVDQDSVYRYLDGTRRPDWRKVLPRIVEATEGQVTADSFLARRCQSVRRVA